MVYFLKKLFVKIKWGKVNSPTQKAKSREGNINQVVSINNSPETTWIEKKRAAEKILMVFKSFFLSALGKYGAGGYLDFLDGDGNFKRAEELQAKGAIENAHGNLKLGLKNLKYLEREDQKYLEEIGDSLIKLGFREITIELREKKLSTIECILKKYFAD